MLGALDDGLVGLERVQARRLRDELREAGLDDPRRLRAVGGENGKEILEDVFGGDPPGEPVMARFAALWAAADLGASWVHRRRYALVCDSLSDFVAVSAARGAAERTAVAVEAGFRCVPKRPVAAKRARVGAGSVSMAMVEERGWVPSY